MRQKEIRLNRATYRDVFLLIFMVFASSGCFSMGMPEFVFSPVPSLPQTRLVALIAPPEVLKLRADPQPLGIQYVLAIFPVTRLTVAHGADLFLLETAAEVLQLAGYDPVLVSEQSLSHALQTFPFKHVLRPQVQDLAVNAYDAFFFRILRVSAIVQVEELRTDNSQPRRNSLLVVDESQYRSDGHASTLSALLKRSLSDALKKGFRDLASPIRTASTPSRNSEEPPIMALSMLTGSEALRPAAATLEASYGFPGALGYTERSISRLVQRGMQAALESHAISAVSTALGSASPLLVKQPVWSLTGTIEELTVGEDLSLGLKLQLEEVHPGAQASVLLRAYCRRSFKELDTLDGSWVFTLEQASGQLLLDFLERGEGCSAIS